MGRRVQSLAALLTCASLAGPAAAAETYDIRPELWDRPRTASAIVSDESVRRAVSALLARADAQLVIHHAAAQEPLLQAEELRAWLAALAIDTRRVALRAGLAPGASLRLEVTP